MKKTEIQKQFLEMIESATIPKGFEKQKTNEGYEYIKKNPQGFVGITPFINQYDTLFFISLAIQLRIHEVSKILVQINNISDEFKDDYSTLSFGIDSLVQVKDSRIKVESPEELEEALRFLKNILEEKGIVFFESIKSIDELDKEINRDNRPKDLYCNEISIRPFVGLTSAVLNKNPKSIYWENYYREKLLNANQHIKNQYEKLVAYLKENYPEDLT